jgi:outer membrane biosynthesis protein TonB
LVAVDVLAAPDGKVRATDVKESPPEALSQAVVEALKAWTFQPNSVGGAPVCTSGRLSFRFSISSAGAEVIDMADKARKSGRK